jgi:kynureninase
MLEEQCGALGVKVTCPRKYEERGGAVIFSHPGAGSVTEALLAHGVVSSFRKPDSIRFGVSPVALSHEDLWNAVARLRDVLRTEVWRDAKFSKVSV